VRKPNLLMLFILFCIWLGGSLVVTTRSASLPKALKDRDRQGSELQSFNRARAAEATGPYYVVLPPAAFTSDGAAPDAFRIDADYGYLHGTHMPTNLWAPLHLPRGVAINSVEVGLEDWEGQPGHDVCVYLDRMSLETGDYECCLVEICSYGGDEGYVTLVENGVNHPVVSDLYAYQLNIYGLYPETYIFGVRVGYSFAEHLPAVMSP
jgi:hypothetical protein